MQKSKQQEKNTKVMVNVYEPIIGIMKHKVDAACLKRDAYLDLVLRCESKLLRTEVTKPNSDKAKSYITKSLKQLKLKQLNLSLSVETVELMNEVCKEKNIPRDAFINRVFLLLIASSTMISSLFNGEELRDSDGSFTWNDYWLDPEADVHDSIHLLLRRPNILSTLEEFVKDSPFLMLRGFLQYMEGNPLLYNYAFKKDALLNLPHDYNPLRAENTIGFNTFMTDEYVSKLEVLDSDINKQAVGDSLSVFMQKDEQDWQKKMKLKWNNKED